MDECDVNCQETLKEIERFLDGELEPGVSGQITLHITDCHPCMQHVEFRRTLKALISTKCGGDAVPAALAEKIRGSIRGLDPPA